MVTETELKMNPMLRREAGEDWHDAGLSGELLRAIIRRELAADRVTRLSGLDRLHSDEMEAYFHLAGQVALLKEEYEIGDPSPLLSEES